MRARTALPAVIVAMALIASSAWGAMTNSPSGIDERLRLSWEAQESRSGRPVISGYLYNDYKRPATNVVLLVETLDGSGQVIARTIGFIAGTVPGWNRAYFEVPLRQAGATYRVSVTSFEWYSGSG